MSIASYFSVVSTRDRVFHFQLKGLWTEVVVVQISTQMLALFKQAVDSMEGRRFLVLADLRAFLPPAQQAKEVVTQTMKYAREHNLYKTVEVMPSALSRLAIRQSAEATGQDDFRVVVATLEEAWVEINKLKQSL